MPGLDEGTRIEARRIIASRNDLYSCSLPYTMTFRVLGPHERGRFAPDAWGHLLALSGAGILDAAELEQVIERAMAQLEGRIALDDLRTLMESSGLSDSATLPDPGTLH